MDLVVSCTSLSNVMMHAPVLAMLPILFLGMVAAPASAIPLQTSDNLRNWRSALFRERESLPVRSKIEYKKYYQKSNICSNYRNINLCVRLLVNVLTFTRLVMNLDLRFISQWSASIRLRNPTALLIMDHLFTITMVINK